MPILSKNRSKALSIHTNGQACQTSMGYFIVTGTHEKYINNYSFIFLYFLIILCFLKIVTYQPKSFLVIKFIFISSKKKQFDIIEINNLPPFLSLTCKWIQFPLSRIIRMLRVIYANQVAAEAELLTIYGKVCFIGSGGSMHFV